jgi:hypothetical protein
VSHPRQSTAPVTEPAIEVITSALLVVLVIVLVLVIDLQDFTKRTRGYLRSRLFSHSHPL